MNKKGWQLCVNYTDENDGPCLSSEKLAKDVLDIATGPADDGIWVSPNGTQYELFRNGPIEDWYIKERHLVPGEQLISTIEEAIVEYEFGTILIEIKGIG